MNGLSKLADVRIDLVHLYNLLECATLNQQVQLVRQNADVVQRAQILECDRAVSHANRLSKVKEIMVIFFLICKNLPRHLIHRILPFNIFFGSLTALFIPIVVFLLLLFLLLLSLILLAILALGMIVPLQQDRLSGLDVVLALAVHILEKVQAPWQHEVSTALVLNRALAQVLEVVLRQGALLGDSRGRLAPVRDDDVLLAALRLPDPLLLVDQQALILDRLRIEAPRLRVRKLELLSTAVEHGNYVAAVGLGDASEHFLERVHAGAVEHAVGAIVHHAMTGIVNEKERALTLLIIGKDIGTGRVNRDFDLLVAGVLEHFDLLLAELELEQAGIDDFDVVLGLGQILEALLALDLAQFAVISASDYDRLLDLYV